jgi:hypothetical protein
VTDVWWEHLRNLLRPSNDSLPGRKPTAEDFTPRAVQRAVLQETLQHPATILPGALATVAALWSVAIDLSPASLVALLGCGFVSAAAWVVNYIGRGETFAEKHLQQLRALRMEYERREVEELVLDCDRMGFREGAKEARELTGAYKKLYDFLLHQQASGENASGERFRVLAEDTYRHGMSLLRKALNLFQALQRIDVDTLQRERDTWIRQQQRHGASKNVERNIAAHTKRLERHRERTEEFHALITQMNELETALETAYLEVIDLVGPDAATRVLESGAASRLETAIAAAHRVEQRLQGLDDADTRDDEVYRKVGEQSNSEATRR